MSTYRKAVLIAFACVVVLMLLFPPFQFRIQHRKMNLGRASIWNPPEYQKNEQFVGSIDWGLQAGQIISVTVVAGLLWLCAPYIVRGAQWSAPRARKIVLASSPIIGVILIVGGRLFFEKKADMDREQRVREVTALQNAYDQSSQDAKFAAFNAWAHYMLSHSEDKYITKPMWDRFFQVYDTYYPRPQVSPPPQ